MNKKPLLIILFFLLVTSQACSATKNLQSSEEAGLEISPTANIESKIVNVVEEETDYLQPGESGDKDLFFVLLANHTYEPGCDGVIGFELIITNNSNIPVSQLELSVTDSNGQNYYDFSWNPKSATHNCYQNDNDTLKYLHINSGEGGRIAIRIHGDSSKDISYMLVSLSWSEGENLLSWQIPTPDNYRLSCEPEKWIITPTAFYEHPLGEGWKLIIVELNLTNQSPYWGEYKNIYSKAFVKTEGGYTYPAVIGPMGVPETPGSPYSGEWINAGQLGGPLMVIGGGVATHGPLPPSFSLYNIVRLDRLSQKPIKTHPFSLMFEVAENQTQYTILTDTPIVTCIFPDGSEKWEKGQPVTIDLQEGFGKTIFPTTIESSQFPEIPSQLDVPGKGTLQYQGSARTSYDEYSDLIVLTFQFTSTSGYNTEGNIKGYMVGSDGIVTPYGCGAEACTENDRWFQGTGYFGSGPGQSFITDITFLVAKNSNNLKFIWLGEEGILPAYQVFRIP